MYFLKKENVSPTANLQQCDPDKLDQNRFGTSTKDRANYFCLICTDKEKEELERWNIRTGEEKAETKALNLAHCNIP